ncbi:hypothetical protein LMG26842_05695 [Achromobacter dolens]|uniref:gp53-like domain-containing protein n=1 Tax=Achromobacter dolens TaxID=1287738 RepID=UPI001468564A|nr:hypothetical protein [Achromobacter dolens]CAB3907644.1 hypothetical protein LMG26842_05695 [Achromobacter dolens]
MQASNAPTKIQVPFANSGAKNTIPIPSQVSVTPGLASFTTGFPPATMTPLVAGGVPPYGQDMNGILYAITTIQQWQSAGGSFKYDAAWSAANSGYPAGAVLVKSDSTGFWFNNVDGNTADPDAGGAGWVPAFNYGVAAITGLAAANVTLTAAQWSKPVITLSGTLTANINVVFPAMVNEWLVVNNTTGAFSATCKTASGTGVAVPQGSSMLVWGDGTNLYPVTGNQATQAQVDAGTDDTTIVSPKKLKNGFAISLAANGYVKFPSWLGGLVLQWGQSLPSVSPGTLVAWPTPFPTAMYAIVTGGNTSGSSTTQNETQTNFRLIGGSGGVYWIAIGK